MSRVIRLVRGGLVFLVAVCVSASASWAQVGVSSDETKPLPVDTPLGHVEVLGTGPTDMVLIPGMYVDWTVWESFMQRNAGAYTMYAVTLPGFGATGAPPIQRGQTYSSKLWLNNAVAQIAEMIEERGLEDPVVVGHSLGAQLAMLLASEHGDLVSKVVNLDQFPAAQLSATGARMDQAMRDKIVDERIAPEMAELGEIMWQKSQEIFMEGQMRDLERAAEIGDIAGAVPKSIGMRYYLESLSLDLTDEILGMETPVLVIGASPNFEVMGGRRGSVPANWGAFEKLIEGHDHISFILFNDCAHYITEDQPELLDKTIANYIAGIALSE